MTPRSIDQPTLPSSVVVHYCSLNNQRLINPGQSGGHKSHKIMSDRDNRWKPIVFTITVIVAFTLILFLFIHRSNQQRVRLCPEEDHLLYLDDGGGNGTCYQEKSQGPCPINMILLEQPGNSSLGDCDCDYVHQDRGLVYHKDSRLGHGQCYFIFARGYCPRGEWLVPYKNASCQENLCASCQENLCEQTHPNTKSEWVQMKDGSCVELGKHHRSCESPENVMHFTKFKAFPTCEDSSRPVLSFNYGGLGVPPTRCPTGYSKTRLGHCALDFDFEL